MSKQAHQARRLVEQVMREDGTSISPQYRFNIEVHHVPAPYVLGEMAWVLDLNHDVLLALGGAAETVVWEYLEAYPQRTETVMKPLEPPRSAGLMPGIICARASNVAGRAAHRSVRKC
jgi:hypothetical protein